MKLQFFNDPGHGWLRVPRKILVQLGILDQISSYSYQRGDAVYLEEDCDASKFQAAANAAGLEVTFADHYSGRPSRIRSYEGFKP
jgi:hypothetical protein